MLTEPAFNGIANSYDHEFTSSITGKLQRNITWKYLDKYLPKGRPLKILEINCGTGTDAYHLQEKGHQLIATDLSNKMIEVAQSKATSNPQQHTIQFEVCAFSNLYQQYKGQQFDLIFSNFGGLNCADRKELEQLNRDLSNLLAPGGKLILILMGKHCLMEKLYFLLNGKPGQVNRRSKPADAHLAEGIFQQTYYYSVKELGNIFNSFQLNIKKPVGLFIPPSYLNRQMQNHPVLLRTLLFFEKCLGNISSFSNFGDHLFIVSEKK